VRRRTTKARLAGTALVGALTAAVGVDIAGLADEPGAHDDPISHVETLSVTDMSDDRKLVGWADDVFVGTVIDLDGRTTEGPLPETQYDVSVVDAIKGELTGDVVVSQQGGVTEGGTTVVVNDDDPLEVGLTYLFASRTDPDTGWHTLVPVHGTVLAGSGTTRTGVVDRFEAAEARQVPFTP
jgi:hypothetical protein